MTTTTCRPSEFHVHSSILHSSILHSSFIHPSFIHPPFIHPSFIHPPFIHPSFIDIFSFIQSSSSFISVPSSTFSPHLPITYFIVFSYVVFHFFVCCYIPFHCIVFYCISLYHSIFSHATPGMQGRTKHWRMR